MMSCIYNVHAMIIKVQDVCIYTLMCLILSIALFAKFLAVVSALESRVYNNVSTFCSAVHLCDGQFRISVSSCTSALC